jgi:aspartate/methionine/tyrosine aminotransferase
MVAALQPYEGESNYYVWIDKLYRRKREHLLKILRNAPFNYKVLVPEGGFFALVDISNCIKDIPKKFFYPLESQVPDGDKPLGTSFEKLDNPTYAPDYAFYRWLSVEYGVTPVPLGSFYDNSEANSVKEWKNTNFARFAICKSDETFAEVEKRLTRK